MRRLRCPDCLGGVEPDDWDAHMAGPCGRRLAQVDAQFEATRSPERNWRKDPW